MISIVICSINSNLLSDLRENIDKTIGLPYELMAIDNKIKNSGICQVYNQAASRAKYDYLCFIHEDVIFHTIEWGKEIIELLSDQKIGLVGISGTIYKSRYPSSWSACDSTLYRANCIQHFKDSVQTSLNKNDYPDCNYSEVVLIDGVFMATRKDVWKNNLFDETNFKGFHCYDLDFSNSIREKYKIVVSNNIMLEHFSEGVLNKNWINDTIKFHNKWKKNLPALLETVSSTQIRISNYLALQNILSVLLKHNGYKLLLLKYYLILVFKYFSLNKFRFTKSTFFYIFRH